MSLLLHICCGPCSIGPIRHLLEENCKLTGFFHNPNIHPLKEYLARREGAAQCARALHVPILFDDQAWDVAEWLCAMLPHAKSANRCEYCISSRLEATAKKAVSLGFDAFGTTLLYSRYQPHEFIKRKGEELADKYGLAFLYRDFREYWQEGIDISREWGIYRQAYCGCIFGEAERYSKKLKRLCAEGKSGSFLLPE